MVGKSTLYLFSTFLTVSETQQQTEHGRNRSHVIPHPETLTQQPALYLRCLTPGKLPGSLAFWIDSGSSASLPWSECCGDGPRWL